jgi:hypothetical protein
MTAGVWSITIEQGSVFNLHLKYKDNLGVVIDLTGYTARMQVRKSVKSNDILLALTTENGGITIGGSAGTINIKAIAEHTALLTIKSGVYDLELIPPSGEDDVFRLLQGSVTVSPEVTR